MEYISNYILQKATNGSAGYDLRSSQFMYISPRGWVLVDVNLQIAIPKGHFGLIAARSGMALDSGIVAFNGIIDSDYRGKIGVVLFNHSSSSYKINIGDKIAQLVLLPITNVEVKKTTHLQETSRGEIGFGSTGK